MIREVDESSSCLLGEENATPHSGCEANKAASAINRLFGIRKEELRNEEIIKEDCK